LGAHFRSLAVALVALLVCFDPSFAQMNQPLDGQGDEPEIKTTVYISAFLERLLEVNDKNFCFTAKVLIYMNWVDPRAKELIYARTEEIRAGTGPNCERVCDGPVNGRSTWQACCDSIWLPDFMIVNVVELPEGRVIREEIGLVGPNSNVVTWFSIVQGTFYTDMNVRDYPFDEQDLAIQFVLDNQGSDIGRVVLEASAGGESRGIQAYRSKSPNTEQTDDWDVDGVSVEITNTRFPEDYIKMVSQHPSQNDPAPFVNTSSSSSVFHFDPADGSHNLSEMLDVTERNQQGFLIVIQASRVPYSHVLNIILPIVLCVWLSSVVFFMGDDNLSDRIGTVVTLFLALVAVQFVTQDVLPSSSGAIATQQLVILTYLYLGLIGIESIVVHRISTSYTRQQRYKILEAAEEAAKHELEAKGIPSVKRTLPIARTSLVRRTSSKQSATTGAGRLPVNCPEKTSFTAASRFSSIQVPEAAEESQELEDESASKLQIAPDHATMSCCGKLASTLWYMPRNIRNVEHYGSYVASHVDHVCLIVWLVTYHVFACVLFVVNDVAS